MTRRFEKTIFHAGHQILLILEKVKLICYEFLEKILTSFPFDDAVYEVRFWYFRVDESEKTVWFKYNYFWCFSYFLTPEVVDCWYCIFRLFFFVWSFIFLTVWERILFIVSFVLVDLSRLSFFKILYFLVPTMDIFWSWKVFVFRPWFSWRSDKFDRRLKLIGIRFFLSSRTVSKRSSRRLRNFLLFSLTDLLLFVRHSVKDRAFQLRIIFLYILLSILGNLFQRLYFFYRLLFLNEVIQWRFFDRSLTLIISNGFDFNKIGLCSVCLFSPPFRWDLYFACYRAL